MKTFIKFFKDMPKDERNSFALSCGTSVGYIFKIIHSNNLYFGPILSRKFEEKSNGIVSRKELRPHDWQDLWPELAKQNQTNSDELIPGEAVDWGDREVPHLPPLEPDDDRIEIGCSSAK